MLRRERGEGQRKGDKQHKVTTHQQHFRCLISPRESSNAGSPSYAGPDATRDEGEGGRGGGGGEGEEEEEEKGRRRRRRRGERGRGRGREEEEEEEGRRRRREEEERGVKGEEQEENKQVIAGQASTNPTHFKTPVKPLTRNNRHALWMEGNMA
jgi:hypothetical protein